MPTSFYTSARMAQPNFVKRIPEDCWPLFTGELKLARSAIREISPLLADLCRNLAYPNSVWLPERIHKDPVSVISPPILGQPGLGAR